jgi:uncharacterized protein (DUF1499 family)
LAEIDFETLKLHWKPNQFLMAPPGMCQNAEAHMESTIYQVPVQTLHDAFMAMTRRQPRTSVVEQRADGERLVQRSRVFRFPDVIDVKFFHIDDSQSTLAVYSRAKRGVRDFGVNEARVRSWVGQMESDLQG